LTRAPEPVPLLALRALFALPFYLGIACLPLAMGAGNRGAPLRGRELLAVACLGLLGFYLASACDILGLPLVSAGLSLGK
jgi:hypothetical protein